jgi:hypothetical protein
MKIPIFSFTVLLLVFTACIPAVNGASRPERSVSRQGDDGVMPSGCTVFTIARGGRVFFGGNDDYINPDSYYWVDPGDSTRYGVIWIGTPDNVQQGVNEKGLAYDANGLPRVDVNPHNERIPVSGDYNVYPILLMHECATVDEVVKWIDNHQWHSYMHDQMQFADATGDAVIISAGKDGEIVFTRKPSGDGFLVSTNFNVANPSNGFGYPDPRYTTTSNMLEQLLQRDEPPSLDDVTGVLDAAHVEDGASWTLESMAADLKNGVVYLYYYYQYDRPVILNVKEELTNPREAGALSQLFPEDVRETASKRYNKAVFKSRIFRIIGMSWIAAVFASIILMLTVFGNRKEKLRYWLPSVVFLGPIALILRFLTVKIRKKERFRNALVETAGDLVPVVVSYTIALTVLLVITLSKGAGQGLQLLLMFGLPLVMGWLIFHGTGLSFVNGKKRAAKFLLKRLPQVIVTTFLGLAGVISIALPVVNKNLPSQLLVPLSPWVIMVWWAIVLLGGLGGGLLIFFFESWSVRKGFHAWTVLAGSEGEVLTPSWAVIWWWIPVSFAIMLAGLFVGVSLLS